MARAKAKYEIVADDKSKKAFDSVQDRIRKTTGAFRGMGSTIAGIAGAAGIGAMVKSAIDGADEIQKLSIQLGASTEFLSEMQHAADLSGVSFKSFTTALRNQQRVLVEAADGSKTYVELLDKIGLSAENLKNLAPEQQFQTIARAMQGLSSETERSAVAQELFGGRASEVLRIINQGPETLAAMREEARELGLSLSRDAADGAANANDAITRLQGAFKGIGLSIAADFAEPLSGAVDFLRGTVVPALGFLIDLVTSLGTAFGGLGAAIGQALDGNFSGALSTLKTAGGDFAGSVADSFSERVEQGGSVLSRLGQPSPGSKDNTAQKVEEQTPTLKQIERNTARTPAAVAG